MSVCPPTTMCYPPPSVTLPPSLSNSPSRPLWMRHRGSKTFFVHNRYVHGLIALCLRFEFHFKSFFLGIIVDLNFFHKSFSPRPSISINASSLIYSQLVSLFLHFKKYPKMFYSASRRNSSKRPLKHRERPAACVRGTQSKTIHLHRYRRLRLPSSAHQSR